MARYDINKIINNASKKNKKKYDFQQILNNANQIRSNNNQPILEWNQTDATTKNTQVINTQKAIAPTNQDRIYNKVKNNITKVLTSDAVQNLATNIKNQNEKKLKEGISNRIVSRTNNLTDNYKIDNYYDRNRQNIVTTDVIIDKEGNVYKTFDLSRDEIDALKKIDGTRSRTC